MKNKLIIETKLKELKKYTTRIEANNENIKIVLNHINKLLEDE